MKQFWQKYMLLIGFCVFCGIALIAGYISAMQNTNYSNAVIEYGDGQEIKVYEEYPFRRLNDLNTHYIMRHGKEVYIEKVVDITTGNVYYLTMSRLGDDVSISPVYDADGKIMKLKPMKEKE